MVTNDGATILKSLYVDNPAAKVLVGEDCSSLQTAPSKQQRADLCHDPSGFTMLSIAQTLHTTTEVSKGARNRHVHSPSLHAYCGDVSADCFRMQNRAPGLCAT